MRNTIKKQVHTAINQLIDSLKNKGVEHVKFQDIEFETDDYFITCKNAYNGYGFDSYEVRLAWNYMRCHYDYGRYKVEGENGNCKFFRIGE